ncbi:MAG: type II toxin-antitoxin system VapC family toxin [Chitinophagales bacterium]|nr:type II toxin-antitoxin system VapC family toxin [Saprospiraceae bacterium]MBN8678797.1 type II toxin-antitoxin system VapC family toxin [Chitinophagales bacterium]
MVGVFDTNILVDLLRNQREAPRKILDYTEIYIPATVAGELLFGAKLSSRPLESTDKVLLLLQKSTIIEANLQVADAYASIRHHLKVKGTPIPENDIWIAASAFTYDLPLITRDNHFSQIDFLKVEYWD